MNASDEKILQTDIFDLINFQGTEEEQMKILAKLTATLDLRMADRILTKLSPSDREEYAQLVGKMDTGALTKFVKTKLPGMEELVKTEVVQLKKDYMKAVADTKSKRLHSQAAGGSR